MVLFENYVPGGGHFILSCYICHKEKRIFVYIQLCLAVLWSAYIVGFHNSFFSMTLLGEKFLPRVFLNSVSLEQIVIFTLSRIILIWLAILIIKYKWKINEEYTGYFVLIDMIISLLILHSKKLLAKTSLPTMSY